MLFQSKFGANVFGGCQARFAGQMIREVTTLYGSGRRAFTPSGRKNKRARSPTAGLRWSS
jgi:hypothetical protein